MADDPNTPQGNPGPDATPNADVSPQQQSAGGDKVLTFTQAEFDAKMASHKRGLQRDLANARQQANSAVELKGQVQNLLDLGIVPEGSNLEDLSTALDGLMTDKERFERDATQKDTLLKQESERASNFETLFRDSTRQQALSKAMSDRVVNEGAADLVQLLLKDKAVYGEDHSVAFTMSVKGEDGKETKQTLSAEDALNVLEGTPSKYGTLFKSTVNAGAGGQLPDGTPKNNEGGIDFGAISFQDFNKIAESNPDALNDYLTKMK